MNEETQNTEAETPKASAEAPTASAESTNVESTPTEVASTASGDEAATLVGGTSAPVDEDAVTSVGTVRAATDSSGEDKHAEDTAGQAGDAAKSAAQASESSAGQVGAEGEGKKKKRRRKKKKKPESDSRPAQAFTHLFGKAARQTTFKSGELVAGVVINTDDGALTVDLFGRGLAFVDGREPHVIEPLPEPRPPTPKAAARDAAPEAAASEAAASEAVASEAVAAEAAPTDSNPEAQNAAPQDTAEEAVAKETPAAENAEADAVPSVVSAEAGAEAVAKEASLPATDASAEASSDDDDDNSVEAESSEDDPGDDSGDEKDDHGIAPVSLEPDWPEPPVPAIGSVFRGRVGSVAESGHMALVNRAVDRAGTKAAIRLARDESRRVFGVVFGYNRGGFDVLVSGVRCFCPARSMSLTPIRNPDSLLGKKVEFSVPPSRGGKSIIVSRRGILEREARKASREYMKSLAVGSKLDGVVTQVRDYGLLVEIGEGVEGLVHQSEVSWSRGDKPSDVAKPGDKVKVEVLKVQPASRKDRYGKVSLSMKSCLADPWEEQTAHLKQGVPLKGKVVRNTDFGAFIELAPGVEGLLHISELGRDIKHANQVLTEGEELDIVIERMDKKQRRLSLSRLSAADLKAIEAGEMDLSKAPKSLKPGTHIKVKITRTEHHGIFCQVEGVIGKRGRGYIPGRELPETGDRKKTFSQGSIVEVKIIGTDRDGSLKMSVKGKQQDEERSAVREYRKEAAQQGGFGTFADLLKQKLGKE